MDLKLYEEFQYIKDDGNELIGFYEYLNMIPDFYGANKWLDYKNYKFIMISDTNKFFIIEYSYKGYTLNPQKEKEVTKKELLHTIKLLIRKEKISKIKEINLL